MPQVHGHDHRVYDIAPLVAADTPVLLLNGEEEGRGGVVCAPMALWAAAVSAAEQRWDEAVDGCTAAIEAANRLGARPWAVLARAHLAAALSGRQTLGHPGRAAHVLAAARRDAEQLCMAAAL